MLENSSWCIGRFSLAPRSEKKWYGTHVHKPDVEWNEISEIMMLNFSESGHPVFRGSSALERAKQKEKQVDSTYQWLRRNHRGHSSHSYFRQSAQGLRSRSGHVLRRSLGICQKARKVRGNPERLRIWKQRKSRQKIQLLRLMQEYRETCCVNTSRDSQIFQNTFN